MQGILCGKDLPPIDQDAQHRFGQFLRLSALINSINVYRPVTACCDIVNTYNRVL